MFFIQKVNLLKSLRKTADIVLSFLILLRQTNKSVHTRIEEKWPDL